MVLPQRYTKEDYFDDVSEITESGLTLLSPAVLLDLLNHTEFLLKGVENNKIYITKALKNEIKMDNKKLNRDLNKIKKKNRSLKFGNSNQQQNYYEFSRSKPRLSDYENID